MAADDTVTTGADALNNGVAKLSVDNTKAKTKKLSLASQSVHADDQISIHRAIAPAMHVSTTFKYNRDPDELRSWENTDVSPSLHLDANRHS